MQKYFDVYYPQAIETGAALRRAGADHYTWTTGSWLLYEYLEQATAEQRRAMEQAIAAGDISWHALPFSWQTEMLDRSMIEGALGLSRSLDARFGHKTIAAKMTDVPGHTRGIIAPLAAAGISLLDIGVNAASTPADVPDVFLWKAPDGSTLPMIYHHHDLWRHRRTARHGYCLLHGDARRQRRARTHRKRFTRSIRAFASSFPAPLSPPQRSTMLPPHSPPPATNFPSSPTKSATPGSTASPAIRPRSRAIARPRVCARNGSRRRCSRWAATWIAHCCAVWLSRWNTPGAPTRSAISTTITTSLRI